MMLEPPVDLATFEARAEQVAETLKALGNARRLMLLCKLVEHGEVTVSNLARDVGMLVEWCDANHHGRRCSFSSTGSIRGRRERQPRGQWQGDPL